MNRPDGPDILVILPGEVDDSITTGVEFAFFEKFFDVNATDIRVRFRFLKIIRRRKGLDLEERQGRDKFVSCY